MVVRILTISYPLAWLICAVWGPTEGVVALALVAALVALPFFLTLFLRQILIAGAITLIVAVVSILCPPLAFLAAAWAVINLCLKFMRFARNLIPIAAGFGMYALLLAVPGMLTLWSSGKAANLPLATVAFTILLAGGGAALFLGLLRLMERLGYKPTLAAAMMLGFPVYLILFALTFLLPGFGDIDAGGDGDTL
jgi:hypothetical protein